MFKCFNKRFIKLFYLKKIKNFILKTLYFVNLLIPKDNNLIIAFIDYEEVNGNLVPYKNDNVYIIASHIEEVENDFKIIYFQSNQFGGQNNKSKPISKKVKHMYYRLRAKVLIFKQPPHITNYFTKKQHLVCLGYFIPFKSDYLDITKWWTFYKKFLSDSFQIDSCKKYSSILLSHVTYSDKQFNNTNLTYITSSKYASKAISRSHNLPIKSFKVLGSLKSETIECKNISLDDIYNLESTNKTIVLYTPTFRDKYLDINISNAKKIDLNIFGYDNEKEELEEFLVENNILLVIKLHKSFPFYRELEKLHMKEDKSYFKNCYFLDFETETKNKISIYDLFAKSNAMIADYSSISFDYLPYNKPIIYNIPDIEDYREYRGFSYEPIEDMMPGDKVRTIDEFKESLLRIKIEDNYKNERELVLKKINEIPRGKSLGNIYGYIEEIIN